MKNLKTKLMIAALVAMAMIVTSGDSFSTLSRHYLAGLMPFETVTPESLKKDYQNNSLKILLVPGHDNQDYGTEFKDMREADLTLHLAKYLSEFLAQDNQLEVAVTRDLATGEYDPGLAAYFQEQGDLISDFIAQAVMAMRSALSSGIISKKTDGVPHNRANSRVTKKLYGINKWANENAVDLVLHIHFNDYGERWYGQYGEHDGFTIYVPDKQFSSSRASKDMASEVLGQLSQNFGVSTLRGESDGITEDQQLIAVGANGSLDAAALLIEYGYIYEPQFTRKGIRDSMMRELAFQTYLGVEKYFNGDSAGNGHGTTLLPYRWESVLKKGVKGNRDVISLQAALRSEGLFPPAGKTLTDCPINGNFGGCTEEAVKAFQERYATDILAPFDLASGNGIVGPKTIEKLNTVYGIQKGQAVLLN